MLKYRSSFNGVQSLNFSYGFHLLLRYSTAASISAEANPNFANYFVEYLGFSRQHALTASTKLARYRHIRGFKKNYGIPIETIRKFILRMPFTFTRKPDVFEDVVIRVDKTLGIARNSSNFLLGIHMLASVNEETFNSKIETFKSFGWTESDVLALFRRYPSCFGLSVATIKKKLAFLMTELGYQPGFSISWPLLTYSLEKRIVPRHMVILALKEKGLIRMDYPFHSTMSLSESRFLERFVLPFKEVHEYSKHVGLSMEVLTQTLQKNNPDPAR